ncbi:type IV pilus biogenesis protein PilM [Bacillus sp. EB600]|uniref:type IV pilus biogenesis protein PilM n=1 Tax=Bacillus sp. EB600 TaxID=2806345 RepID=UPI00210DD0C7|nr:pilus assembly protein PilM [Bacillus sp. EB600]MCQ6278265.1 pilus assembly protein PilM [Bacillus sp. EB600]
MALSLFSLRNRIVNLVINDHSIRFLELKQANPPTAQRWCERFLPPGIINDGKILDAESLANIVDECIDEWKIQRRQVRFIVPDSLVIIRKVSIPAEIQDDEIHGYLYLEMGSSIHLPFEDPVFDTFPLTSNEKTKDLLLFAAPEKCVMEYADLLSDLKLNPIAADISSLAIYRLYHQLGQAKENEVLCSVQFDLTNVNMCVFEAAAPYVMRSFPLNYETKNWEMKQSNGSVEYKYLGEANLAMEFEDVFHEINKLLDFYRYSLYNGKKEVTNFLISGDHPLLQLIDKEMKDRYDLPVSRLDFGETANGKAEMLPYKFYLPLGLALKEVK